MFSILKWFGHTIHESIKTALIDNDDTISIRDKLYIIDDEIGVTEHIRPENDRETDLGVLGRQFRKIFGSELRSELDEIGGTAELLLESKHSTAKTTVKAFGAGHGTVDIVAVGSVDSIINLEADSVNVDGDLSVTGSIPDHDVIAEHTTTETDADKYLKADGTGGLEFGTPAGGNGKGIFRILPVSLLSSGDGGDNDVIAESTSRTYRSHVGAATGQTRNYFQAETLPPDFHSMDRIIVETYRTGTTTSFTLTLSKKGTDDDDLTNKSIRPTSAITWQTFTFTDFDLNYSAGDQIMLKFVSTLSSGQGQFISRIHIIYNRS